MGKHRFVGDRHGKADRFGNLPHGTLIERRAEPDADDDPAPERAAPQPERAAKPSALRRALGAREPSKPTGDDTGTGR
jgi:hypothetical protein